MCALSSGSIIPPCSLRLPTDNGFDCTIWLEWKEGVTVSFSPWGECLISRHEFTFVCHLMERAFIVGQVCMKPLIMGCLVGSHYTSHKDVVFHVAYSEEQNWTPYQTSADKSMFLLSYGHIYTLALSTPAIVTYTVSLMAWRNWYWYFYDGFNSIVYTLCQFTEVI